MPLYEYQCDACGGRFERIRKFSDPPLEEPCPTCGGPIRKLLSSPAIQFKGSGWYVTDYAKSAGQGDSKTGDTPSDTKADGKKADGAGEKPEAKAESKADSTSKPAAATTPASTPKT